MITISVYADPTILSSLIHEKLNEIAERFPCIAKFRNGEITVECYQRNAAAIENMLADLV